MKLNKIKYICEECLKYQPEMSECRLEYDLVNNLKEERPPSLCPFDQKLEAKWKRNPVKNMDEDAQEY